MRVTRPFANCKFHVSALLICALSRIAFAAEPTALSLIKEGNDYVGKDSRDKVVQIRSEKSIGSLTPNIWFVVYYDPDATFKATEVKFGAGKKMDVKRPFRALEILNADKVFDQKKLKTDSDPQFHPPGQLVQCSGGTKLRGIAGVRLVQERFLRRGPECSGRQSRRQPIDRL